MRSPLWTAKYTALLKLLRSPLALVSATLLVIWCVGMFGRGYWTPDEPREADIAWRMSWQADKAVPLLAGEAFCEKPPLTYWLAAVPIRLFGTDAWAARLPNLLYALITALGVGLLARRSAGRLAGMVGAAAISTFLLSYQVAIWLATDAPLLAAVSVALLGAYRGFYAASTRERLRGYSGCTRPWAWDFSARAPPPGWCRRSAIVTLAIWEKRWRELLRWELYVGLVLQAAMIFTWMWFVYAGPDGPAHLKVFFWNNLGRPIRARRCPERIAIRSRAPQFSGQISDRVAAVFVSLDPAGHRRPAPRVAAARHSFDDYRPVRFAVAASLPALAVLSLAATARNVYFAPALPGVALLLAWWAREIAAARTAGICARCAPPPRCCWRGWW